MQGAKSNMLLLSNLSSHQAEYKQEGTESYTTTSTDCRQSRNMGNMGKVEQFSLTCLKCNVCCSKFSLKFHNRSYENEGTESFRKSRVFSSPCTTQESDERWHYVTLPELTPWFWSKNVHHTNSRAVHTLLHTESQTGFNWKGL